MPPPFRKAFPKRQRLMHKSKIRGPSPRIRNQKKEKENEKDEETFAYIIPINCE